LNILDGLALTGQAGKVLAVKGDESGAEFVPMGQFPDGTAAAPSITNTGDTNTGVFFPAADTVAVATGGSERMRVDSSGNVGIGTSSPGTYGRLVAVSPDNTSTTQVITAISNNLGQSVSMTFAGFRANAGAGIGFAVNGSTTNAASIDSSGNLLVGTTTFRGRLTVEANSALTAVPFDSNDTRADASSSASFSFRRQGTQVGSISTTTTATAYNTSSDYRLKENVQPMQDALATVAQLNPVTYTWAADGSDGQGFIAHELQAVVPDCVTGEKDAVDAEGNPQYQGVDTSFLVATLVKAVQELNARIAALEAAQ
jgi:hypothetical protein